MVVRRSTSSSPRPAPAQDNSSTPRKSGITRRVACRAALALPLAVQTAHAPLAATLNDKDELASLIRVTERQADLFMKGEMNEWIKLLHIPDDFTLMQPFGGPVSHGFDPSPEHLAQMAAAFKNGEARLELVQHYRSGDIVVLVMIEHQRGEVAGLPDQDWSLRVTQVYRRQGGKWWVIHRHADPLVRHASIPTAAALARGAQLTVQPAE